MTTTTHEPHETLRSLLAGTVEKHPERPAITYALGATGDQPAGLLGRTLRTLTWHELAHLVLEVARTLDGLDATRSARTVAILADTDARYPLLELAVGLTGRVLQPLYTTATDDELQRALAMSKAEVLVVGRSQANRARAGSLHPATVSLDAVVRLPGIDGTPHAALPPQVEPFDTHEVLGRLAGLGGRPTGASLLYMQSTGTTGPARVIDLSEAAVVAAVRAVKGEASHQFPRMLSFLPTAHISERLLTQYVSIALAGHTFYGGGLATLVPDLRACRPTIVLAPPLLLAAIRAEATAAARATSVGRRLLASVQKTADAMLSGRVTGRGRRFLGARLFGRTLRKGVGLDQVRDALTGTAPVTPDLHAWFEAVGLPLRIVYGQTEVAGATSMTARAGATFGAVGVLVAGVDARLSDDGELLVRAESAFTRYLGDAAATARVLDDGWLRSGDRATMLPGGEIAIGGRRQSLLTVGGATVDVGQITARVSKALGGADVVFAKGDSPGSVFLYVAAQAPGPDVVATRPVPDTDARWDRLAESIESADPHHVVRGWALFDGAFTQATGEVGPTGKARGWRIHELRSKQLRNRSPVTIEVSRSTGTQSR
jgi:long-chain acyl-CoA synthetase